MQALARLARSTSTAASRAISPLSSARILGLVCTRRPASFQGVGGGPTGGSGSSPAAAWEASYLKHFGNDHSALNTWMATYYRQAAVPMETQEEVEMAAKVHGERIVGALFASLQNGLLAGPGSLSAAVFWAGILQPAAPDDCMVLLQDVLAMADDGRVPSPEEQCDTFYRALFLKNNSELDEFLQSYADACLADAWGYSPPPPPPDADPADVAAGEAAWQMRLASLRSLYPARHTERAVLRQPVYDWPVPALDLASFEETVNAGEVPLAPYCYTAFHLFRAFELRNAPSEDREATLYPTASSLSAAVLDSLWASFYVTGDERNLARVAQVAAKGIDFAKERLGGKRGVAKFLRALIASDDPSAAVAKLCEQDDAEGRLIMASGTSACLSIIDNCNTNEEVWEKLMAYGGEHDDEAVKETARLVAVVRAAEDVAGASYSRPTDDDNGPRSGA